MLDDDLDYDVFGQRFSALGLPLGGEFPVNTFTSGIQFEPQVAGLADGGFVVTWTSYAQDTSDYGIYAQRYDAAGKPAAGEFRVNTTTRDRQISPSVAALSGGGFVIVWQSGDRAYWGVFGQRYDAAGTPIGGEFQVNTYWPGDQFGASIAALKDGGFVVVWHSISDDSQWKTDIFGQRYDSRETPPAPSSASIVRPHTTNQIPPLPVSAMAALPPHGTAMANVGGKAISMASISIARGWRWATISAPIPRRPALNWIHPLPGLPAAALS